MTAPAIKYVIVETRHLRPYTIRGLAFETPAAAEAHIVATYKERFRSQYRVESREVKADDTGLRMHCQCCGRAILANTGSIALHGYERPGEGWQTASCAGAKELPWEVSRDAVARLISHLKSVREVIVQARADVANEVMDVARHYTRHERGKRTPCSIYFSRATFDEKKAENKDRAFDGFYGDDATFDGFKNRDLRSRDAKIKKISDDIVEFQARYDGWKQTHRWNGKTKNWEVL